MPPPSHRTTSVASRGKLDRHFTLGGVEAFSGFGCGAFSIFHLAGSLAVAAAMLIASVVDSYGRARLGDDAPIGRPRSVRRPDRSVDNPWFVAFLASKRDRQVPEQPRGRSNGASDARAAVQADPRQIRGERPRKPRIDDEPGLGRRPQAPWPSPSRVTNSWPR